MKDVLAKLTAVGSFVVAYWQIFVAALIIIALLAVVDHCNGRRLDRRIEKRDEKIEKLNEEAQTSEERLKSLGSNTNESIKRAEDVRKSDKYKGTKAEDLERKSKDVYK